MITKTGNRSLIFVWNESRSPERIASALVLVIILSYSFPGGITALTKGASNDSQSQHDPYLSGLTHLKANSLPFQSISRRSATRLPGRWYILTSPDGDFTLSFPWKPTTEEPAQGPTTLIRSFGLVTSNGIRFSINFHDIGGDPLAPESNEWGRNMEQLASEADRKDGLRVVQTHRVQKNIVETELWQTVPENGANINYL